MLVIPPALQEQFEEYLRNKPIPNTLRGAYKKWLRYYLDFCSKYHHDNLKKGSLPHFIEKLRINKQAIPQHRWVHHEVSVY